MTNAWLDYWISREPTPLMEIGYGGIRMSVYNRLVDDVRKKLGWRRDCLSNF